MPRRPQGADLQIEWLDPDDGAPVPEPVSPRPGARRVVAVVAAAATLGALVTWFLVAPDRGGPPRLQQLPPVRADPRPQTIRLRHGLSAVPGSWELVARGTELLRIGLRGGVVVRTFIPALESTGPSYLVAAGDRVIIRPLDSVPGYLAVDGQPARPLSGLLANAGPAFPGPDDRHAWVTADDGRNKRLALVDLDGQPTGPWVPSADTFPIGGDGTGRLVFADSTGAYLEGVDGRSRITTGTLLAIGPTRWLTLERSRQGCQLVATDRATGLHHALGTVTCPEDTAFSGLVSPDGGTAAVVEDVIRGETLHLIDLVSGQDHQLIGIAVRYADTSSGRVVWSPDSRSLWFVTSGGQVEVVDRDGSHLHQLGVELPPIVQLAFRVVAH